MFFKSTPNVSFSKSVPRRCNILFINMYYIIYNNYIISYLTLYIYSVIILLVIFRKNGKESKYNIRYCYDVV